LECILPHFPKDFFIEDIAQYEGVLIHDFCNFGDSTQQKIRIVDSVENDWLKDEWLFLVDLPQSEELSRTAYIFLLDFM